MTDKTKTELDRLLEAHPDTACIDAMFIDLAGTVRGKRCPIDHAAKLFGGGLQFPMSAYLLDVTGENTDAGGRGFSDGDPDGTAVPVPGTLVPVPWAGRPSAQVLMTLDEPDAHRVPVDPRNVAKRVVEAFGRTGLRPVVAFELEFYLIDRERGADGIPLAPVSSLTGRRESGTQVYRMDEIDGHAAFFEEIDRFAVMQRIPVSVATAEYAPGQYEVNLSHVDDPLAAADHCALFRHLVRRTASRHGMAATFMAKPFIDQTGNGMHMHVSLVDADGRNAFDDGTELGSRTLRHAVGGLRATMGEAMAICAANANAYRRFVPNSFVPMSPSWGANNRSLAFRIPAGPGSARRIEHRVAGADANPYLVLAAVLAGMRHGIENALDPGPPSTGNAGAAADPSLPFDWAAAVARLEGATILSRHIDPGYLALYAGVKRFEMAKFAQQVSPLEYAWYL